MKFLTQSSLSCSNATQKSKVFSGPLPINNERVGGGTTASSSNERSISPTVHYQYRRLQRLLLGASKVIKKGKLHTFRKRRLCGTIPQRFMKEYSETLSNVRKNIPQLMSKFFVRYLRKIDFICERYQEIRDLPVFLSICFLYAGNYYQKEDFEKLIQEYFAQLKERIEEQKWLFRFFAARQYKHLHLQHQYDDSKIKSISLPTRARFLISSQVVKDYRLAEQCCFDFIQGKWLDAIKKFHGKGVQKEYLIKNIVCFLEQLKILYKDLDISQRQVMKKMTLKQVEDILEKYQPFDPSSMKPEQEKQEISEENETNSELDLEKLKSNQMENEQPDNPIKPEQSDVVEGLFENFFEEQQDDENEKQKKKDDLVMEQIEEVEERSESKFEQVLRQYDEQSNFGFNCAV